jgi:hypothetical protein
MRIIFSTILCFVPALVAAQEVAQDNVRPRAAAVQSSMLQEVGPWGAAALPDGLSPLPSDLWRNSDPATLGLLLTKISPDQRFPSLQSLTRRTIFSGGTAPTNDPDIARARFEAANRFGPADATARLIFGVPRLASQIDLATIAIDAGLRVGRLEEACTLIEAVTAPPQGTVWLESRAACYALNNEAAAANLSVDLAKSRGLTDTWLSRAIAAVEVPLAAPPPFRVDSGRAVALSLRAKLKPPLTLSAIQDPMAISALVGTADFFATLEPQERMALVKNGASRGAISLATVVSQTPEIDPAASLPPIPAQISQKMLAAPTIAQRSLEARLALDDIKTVMATQPGIMTLADVPLLIEAALWSGEGALARSIANLSPPSLDARLALIVAMFEANNQTRSDDARLDAAGTDPVKRRLAMRENLIAWSAGLPITGGLSHLVQSGLPSAPAGNAGLRAAMDLASGRGAKGEVALLVSLALQGVEPAAVDAETLTTAIKALRRVGFSDAARDLARDYLLASYVTLPARQTTKPRTTTTPPAAPLPAAAVPASGAGVPAKREATPPAPVRPAARTPVTAARPAPPAPRPAARPPPAPPQLPPKPTAKPSWGTP